MMMVFLKQKTRRLAAAVLRRVSFVRSLAIHHVVTKKTEVGRGTVWSSMF